MKTQSYLELTRGDTRLDAGWDLITLDQVTLVRGHDVEKTQSPQGTKDINDDASKLHLWDVFAKSHISHNIEEMF